MSNARMKINALTGTVVAVAALALVSPSATAEEAGDDYDAVDHWECFGTFPPYIWCEITGVDCLPNCYTGTCCTIS